METSKTVEETRPISDDGLEAPNLSFFSSANPNLDGRRSLRGASDLHTINGRGRLR